MEPVVFELGLGGRVLFVQAETTGWSRKDQKRTNISGRELSIKLQGQPAEISSTVANSLEHMRVNILIGGR